MRLKYLCTCRLTNNLHSRHKNMPNILIKLHKEIIYRDIFEIEYLHLSLKKKKKSV